MEATFFAILTLAALVQADRDLSAFKPIDLNVIPQQTVFWPRIVGGEEARPRQFPHQVALFIEGGFFCGGSILNARNILTAAHCVDAASYVEVVAGAHNIRKYETSQQNITSYDIVVHPGWDRRRLINDVAILHLSKPLKFNEYVKPINLYGGSGALAGEKATVSGWGKDSDSATGISDKLRYVTNAVITNNECKRTFLVVVNSVICVSGRNGKGSCNGDSGGPLIRNNFGVNEQIGIVSYGNRLGCEIGSPTAYTRISSFKSWITNNLSR